VKKREETLEPKLLCQQVPFYDEKFQSITEVLEKEFIKNSIRIQNAFNKLQKSFKKVSKKFQKSFKKASHIQNVKIFMRQIFLIFFGTKVQLPSLKKKISKIQHQQHFI
jgi:hypothetical protein